MRTSPWRFLAVPVLLVAVLGGCSAPPSSGQADAPSGPAAGVLPEELVAPLVDAVPHRTVTALPAARLADGLLPPTNRWFSGLVFGEPSMPVFPLPLSFQLTGNGLSFGVPQVTASSAVIMGGFTGSVRADVGAREQRVVAYDAASVTVASLADGQEIGRSVIAQGSPFVSFTATRDTTVRMSNAFTPGTDAATATIADTAYGLVSEGELHADGASVTLATGDSVTWFAVPQDGSLEDLIEAARHPVLGTSVSYAVEAGKTTTAITYRTAGDADTLIAVMPHQEPADSDCSLGTYASIYGELRLCRAATLSWTAPLVEPAGSLDLSGLDPGRREDLLAQLASDVTGTAEFPADTYFGGKALYRAANLLSIARDLGADDLAATLQERLEAELALWMDPAGCDERSSRCFVYDPEARGMVGLEPSFGSDQFNDHHFHYGYFLYAAGVLAADKPELADEWAPVMNLLAADLATSEANPLFPERRVFDAYAGHSWASGTSPFGDGNNQESSSEAVTAWNGLALWAAASEQPDLYREAVWMLSSEAASARAYWTDFPLDAAVYDGFDHTITSLVWGGKRDYATWFSAEPSAMLGILVLPMSPISGYLAGDPERIAANIDDAAPDGFDVLFGDYLLMYSALAGPDAAAQALDNAAELPASRIDDGNSRTYLLAWLMSRLNG
ncbi:glycosyl hydrolase [Mycetocola sp. 2940]|uniref:glycosyl hydrolase n=1 Tax=Mycetocola sp. 2940 TaxID=3156452 RepID=UPI00339B46DD